MKKNRAYHFWSLFDHKHIEDNYQSSTDKEMAAQIGVTTYALTQRRVFLGFLRPYPAFGINFRQPMLKREGQ